MGSHTRFYYAECSSCERAGVAPGHYDPDFWFLCYNCHIGEQANALSRILKGRDHIAHACMGAVSDLHHVMSSMAAMAAHRYVHSARISFLGGVLASGGSPFRQLRYAWDGGVHGNINTFMDILDLIICFL